MALVVAGFFAATLFWKWPSVWPDEALFADAARSLLTRGKLATPALAGLLPGIEQHTYWVPPLYLLSVSALFAIFGVNVSAMRAFSLLHAVLVLLLTHRLARQAGLSRWAGLVPPSLVAANLIFLRAALVGRMDLLAIVFFLSAMLLLENDPPRQPVRFVLLGLFCGLALATHPVGAMSGATVLIMCGVSLLRHGRARAEWHRVVAPLALGAAVVLLPWAVYALRDPSSFLAQYQGQFVRKLASGSASLALEEYLNQLRVGHNMGRLFWLTGLLGLTLLALRRGRPTLLVGQLLLFAAILSSREMWYPIYPLPLTALGITWLAAESARVPRIGKWLSGSVLGGAVFFAAKNVEFLEQHRRALNVQLPDRTNYHRWSADVSAALSGGKVLLAVIPDPYFALVGRADLEIHEFLPEGIPIERERYRARLEEMDFLVVGRWAPAEVLSFVAARGRLVGQVGSAAEEDAYLAHVFKVTNASPP